VLGFVVMSKATADKKAAAQALKDAATEDGHDHAGDVPATASQAEIDAALEGVRTALDVVEKLVA